MVTTLEKAIVIELKNWSGELTFDGPDYIQIRRFTEERVNHGPVFADLEEKTRVLREYNKLQGRPDVEIEQLLVFYNSNLGIPPALARTKGVVFYGDLVSHLPSRDSGLRSVLEAILRFLGIGKQKPKASNTPAHRVERFKETLLELGSWDYLSFAGGQIKAGDIHTEHESFNLGEVRASDRDRIESIEFTVGRRRLAALFRDPPLKATVSFRNGDSHMADFGHDVSLVFQPAGSREAEPVSLFELERLEYGYTCRPSFHSGWEDIIVGDEFTGVVTGVQDFGIFVNFGGPRDGLVPLAGLGDRLPNGNAEVGRRLRVRIVGIDKRQGRIKLDLVITSSQ